VEEVDFDEGSLYFKSEKQGCFAKKKRLNMTRKRWERQSKFNKTLIDIE